MDTRPYKVFETASVPRDELDDVRRILEANRIRYYETPKAEFGISVAALWVEGKERHQKARRLIASYQKERRDKIREDFEKHERPFSWRAAAPILAFVVLVPVFTALSFCTAH